MTFIAFLLPTLLMAPCIDAATGRDGSGPAILVWSPPRAGADLPAPQLRFSIDGHAVAVSESDGSALVWQDGSGPKQGRIGEGGRLTLSDETSIDLREVDAARGDGDPGGRPSILRARLASSLQAVSPDVVVVRYQGGGCLAWDLETGTVSVLQEEPKGSAGGGKPAPEIRIEERGFLVAASPDGGVRLSSLDKGEILLTLLFFEDDQWLVFEAGLGYLASGDAPDHLRLVTGGKAYPLTCYSGLLWSSFSVGSRLAGRPLPTPKILPPPGVEVVEEAPGREGTPTRLVITARDPVGIVSIVVVQGERETIYPGEGSQEVRVVHAVSADGAPGRLAVTAVNAMNVASSAVRRVDRDPKR